MSTSKLKTKVVFIFCCFLFGGCGSQADSLQSTEAEMVEASPLLYVWAGDQDMRPSDSDFLAVLDADPTSSSYGEVLETTPVGFVGTHPHHAEPVAPKGALLFANGYDSGRTFLFDLSNPAAPSLRGELDPVEGYAYPHSFLRLSDNTLLATLQYGDGSTPGNPGGLARFGPDSELLEMASASDPEFKGEIIRPYSIEVIPSLDRVVTTSRTMNTDIEQAADLIQIWSLSTLGLLNTLRVPRIEPAATPECILGTGILCAPGQYPGEAQPFESRVMPDGSVLMNTLMCGIYRISDIGTDTPRIDQVLNYPEMFGCSVPAIIGDYYILPVMFAETILVLDMSDPENVVEISRFDTPGYQPHWAAADPNRSRIVVTSSGNAPTFTVLMLDFEPQTGQLTLDESFGSVEFPRAGVSFYREDWPHGQTGAAIPHAAFFGER